ncbi:Hypothetical predicted protein [Pelobates cultripes]|nr:Hypothetical predicted protein [Pelobates cultripes]
MEKLKDLNENQDAGNPSDPIVSESVTSEVVTETDMGIKEIPKKKGKKRKYVETFPEEMASEGHTVSDVTSTLDNSLMETTKKKRKKKNHQDTSILANVVENDSMTLLTDVSCFEHESEISNPLLLAKQAKKTKKKRHRDNSQADVEYGVQNGLTEDSVVTECNAFEDLTSVTEPLHENIEKKHKKNHKTKDLDKEFSNGAGSATNIHEPVDQSLEFSQEIPKKIKHKKKHKEHLLQKDVMNREAESTFLDVSLSESEPKPKKKRKA